MPNQIPFNRPFSTDRELQYMQESVLRRQYSGDHAFTKKCHDLLRRMTGADHVLLTTSCTAALEMAAILCDLSPGDEVIVPSYTFVSTANAVALRGAVPVFVDIREDTLNIDERMIEAAITKRTRAIFVVHYAGVACEMNTIMDIASRHRLRVVEDAAQAICSKYNGKSLGTIGDMGAFSFHETKNIICGEGGAFISNDKQLSERAEIIREKGTNRSQFFRGQVDKYTWVDIGSSFLPSDILAGFLLAQLESVAYIQSQRKRVFDRYMLGLSRLADFGAVKLPTIPAGCEPNYHMFYLLAPSLDIRTKLLDHLKRNGIGAVFHYVPLHGSPVGKRFGYHDDDLAVTQSISERLIRLPLFVELTNQEVDHVVASVTGFFKA